jgi:predicted membrane-bound mannosyltransferase
MIISLKEKIINEIISYINKVDDYIKFVQYIPDYCYDENILLETEVFISLIEEFSYYYSLYRTEDNREFQITLTYKELISLLNKLSLLELQFILLKTNEKN